MDNLFSLIADFLIYRKGCAISVNTIAREKSLLNKFARWFDDRDFREAGRKTILDYLEHLENTPGQNGKIIAPISRCSELSALKSFFGFLLAQDKILSNPLEGFRIKTKADKNMRKIFSEEDIGIFLDSIAVDTPFGQMDRALFELMYSSALRYSDAKALKIQQLDLTERILMVTGKGNKDSVIPFSEIARRFLLKYLNDGRKKILASMPRKNRKEAQPRVFPGRVGHLVHSSLMLRFHRYLFQCGLDGKSYTIHSIRHAAATHLLAHGAGIRYVQELLRHEDLKTTQLYTRPDEANIKAMYRSYHPRENEFFREIDSEYLAEIERLKARILFGHKANEQYKLLGHKRGFGRWKG